ncbi:DegT/DnrJ/EryC1/StrS family aminotransferase [Mesotoga sp.]|uniref:DegT/DnrJ/EryC1/StrS family aminotransferase n=1 Tax=Mesotoga sp. TaxID=2053577 RepID=UPI00345F0882
MAYKIPLFDLNFGKEEEDAVIEVLQSKWISMGEKTTELENDFAERINARHALAMTNCTAALHLALAILNIGPGDEVIVPSLTFVATANAVKYVCGTPVFADITSLEDLTISPEDIERKITDKTKAIMVMHYGGFACDMDKIMPVAQKHNLKVVEDAAHSPAATYKGKYLGTIGDVSAFSFFSNKNITTAEGGMLITNDDALAERAKLMRSHGMTALFL